MKNLVYKVIGGETQYLKEFNRQYPGDSTFTLNVAEARCFSDFYAAQRMSRRLNKGLDRGTPKRYGACQIW